MNKIYKMFGASGLTKYPKYLFWNEDIGNNYTFRMYILYPSIFAVLLLVLLSILTNNK